MTQKAKVISTDGIYAVVSVSRKTICEGCHNSDASCSACLSYGDREAKSRVFNSAGAKAGDTVVIKTDSIRIIGYSALVFFVPVAAALIAYFAASFAGSKKEILYALAVFAASFAGACLLLDKKIKKTPDSAIVEIIDSDEKNKRTAPGYELK